MKPMAEFKYPETEARRQAAMHSVFMVFGKYIAQLMEKRNETPDNPGHSG